MSPAAESTGVSAKAGAFDTASLFVADKAQSAEAANTVATLAKKEGVEFFGAIKLNEALVKVSYSFNLQLGCAKCDRGDWMGGERRAGAGV
jgi:hypothetical protein